MLADKHLNNLQLRWCEELQIRHVFRISHTFCDLLLSSTDHFGWIWFFFHINSIKDLGAQQRTAWFCRQRWAISAGKAAGTQRYAAISQIHLKNFPAELLPAARDVIETNQPCDEEEHAPKPHLNIAMQTYTCCMFNCLVALYKYTLLSCS